MYFEMPLVLLGKIVGNLDKKSREFVSGCIEADLCVQTFGKKSQ